MVAKLGGHLVEGVRQLAHFIPPLHGDRPIQIAIELPGHVGERLDPPGRDPRHNDGQDDREQRGDDQGVAMMVTRQFADG